MANFSYDRLRESAGQGYELNEVMERSCLEISVVLTRRLRSVGKCYVGVLSLEQLCFSAKKEKYVISTENKQPNSFFLDTLKQRRH